MQPLVLARGLWGGHRLGLFIVGLLLIVNLVVALSLRYYLVPVVDEREQLLIRRQAEVRRGTGGDAPALVYAQGERDLAEFNKMIPPHREFTGLISELEGLAEEAELNLTQIGYGHKQEKNGLLRYTLGFNVAGKYADIKQFIHALEQSPRLLLIEQISLQGSKGTGDEVRLQLSVATFFREGKE